MLLSLDEMRQGFVGSWKLLRGDPQGMRHFDVSVDGFWRSFSVLFALLPPVLVSVAAERKLVMTSRAMDATDFPTVFFTVMQLLSYALAWYGFPLLLAAIAGPLGLSNRYAPLVVARNWSSLLGILPFLVATLLYVLGLVSANGFGLMTLVSLIFNLYLGYQVAKLSALVPAGTAIGLVILDLFFTMLVANVADRLVGL